MKDHLEGLGVDVFTFKFFAWLFCLIDFPAKSLAFTESLFGKAESCTSRSREGKKSPGNPPHSQALIVGPIGIKPNPENESKTQQNVKQISVQSKYKLKKTAKLRKVIITL